jgi:hypothetical protein
MMRKHGGSSHIGDTQRYAMSLLFWIVVWSLARREWGVVKVSIVVGFGQRLQLWLYAITVACSYSRVYLTAGGVLKYMHMH